MASRDAFVSTIKTCSFSLEFPCDSDALSSDEADMLLKSRPSNTSDLGRNSLVSSMPPLLVWIITYSPNPDSSVTYPGIL